MNQIFRGVMKILLLFSLICLVSVTQGDLPPRSVNVALETSFIFDPKDIHNSKSFINNLRRFLENLNDIQDPQLKSRYLRTVAKRKRTKPKQSRKFNLIDWVWDAGKSFVNLTGDTFNRAVDPIHQRAKKGKDKFGELGPDENILDYIKIWRRQMPEDMKIKINTTLNENNPLLRKIARRMNAYYSDEDVKKLYDILWKFKRYLEKDKDTSNLVKELMNSAIFKKYDSLSEAAKADLKKDFRTFAEYVSMNNNLKSFNKNHGLSYTELRNTIDKKLKDARKGKKNKNKDGKTNELVVNNIELVLEPEGSKITF